MPDDAIISPDTQRAERIPPRQALTRKWPVLHAGEVPPFDSAKWDFTIFPVPLVNAVKRFNWAEFCALPRVKVFADMHCVTRWSKLDNLWEGVATRELLIRRSSLGGLAGVLGASAMVVDQLFVRESLARWAPAGEPSGMPEVAIPA